jgi:hypothetical protein
VHHLFPGTHYGFTKLVWKVKYIEGEVASFSGLALEIPLLFVPICKGDAVTFAARGPGR